ncbi:(R)-specific enoyl-CoA hydratase [bacterium YEK0313]|nr:(R)-specific enoyl-CoA hydratase [bacterium YEK0313]
MNPTCLDVGETASFAKTITEADLVLFAGLTGDFDPIHVNADYAAGTPFGRRIAHGALVMGLLSTTASMMSRRSAERGATGTSVSLGYDRIRFLKPVFIGDTLTARYTIEEVDIAAGRTRSRVEVVNQAGEVCLAGTHIMKWVEAGR